MPTSLASAALDASTFDQTTTKCLPGFKDKIIVLQKQLATALEEEKRRRSLLTKLATLWGKTHIIKKLLLTLIPIVLLVVPGIVLQVAALITLAATLSLFFLAAGLLLQNHHQNEQKSREKLVATEKELIHLFTNILDILETISSQLAQEIETFKQENEKFVATQAQLVCTTKELADVKVDFAEQLTQTKKMMSEEIGKMQQIAQHALQGLSLLVSTNAEQQKHFQERLNMLLETSTVTLTDVFTQMFDTVGELKAVKDALAKGHEQYAVLLEKHEVALRQTTSSSSMYAVGSAPLFAANSPPAQQEISVGAVSPSLVVLKL